MLLMPGRALTGQALAVPAFGGPADGPARARTGEAIMKLRASLTAAGVAALLGTGALVLPAVASASSATHTLKFTAVTNKQIMFTRAAGGSQETDVNAAGKTVGFDVLYFAAVSQTTGNINVTFDINGGFLYGTATVGLKTNKVTNGKVTGGTGAFAGATGKITAKSAGKNREAIKITYST
jgi:hypothetical protein